MSTSTSSHAQKSFLKTLESTPWVMERLGSDVHQVLDFILSPVALEQDFLFLNRQDTFIATYSKDNAGENYVAQLPDAITQFKDMLRLVVNILGCSGAASIDATPFLFAIGRIHVVGPHCLPRFETDESQALSRSLSDLRISATQFLVDLMGRTRSLPMSYPFVTSTILPRIMQNGLKSRIERTSAYRCLKAIAQENGNVSKILISTLKQIQQDIQNWCQPMFDLHILQKSRKLMTSVESDSKPRVDDSVVDHELIAAALSAAASLHLSEDEKVTPILNDIVYQITNAILSLSYTGCNEEYGYEQCRVVIYEFLADMSRTLLRPELAVYLPIWHRLFKSGLYDSNTQIRSVSRMGLESFDVLIHPRQPIAREPAMRISSSLSTDAIPMPSSQPDDGVSLDKNGVNMYQPWAQPSVKQKQAELTPKVDFQSQSKPATERDNAAKPSSTFSASIPEQSARPALLRPGTTLQATKKIEPLPSPAPEPIMAIPKTTPVNASTNHLGSAKAEQNDFIAIVTEDEDLIHEKSDDDEVMAIQSLDEGDKDEAEDDDDEVDDFPEINLSEGDADSDEE